MKAEYDFSKAKRGAVAPAAPGKTRITIRLDNEVIRLGPNLSLNPDASPAALTRRPLGAG